MLAPLGSNPVDVGYDPQILKIDKPDTNENYYISFRKRVGLDASMSSSYTTGVSIHHASENGNRSYLIDVLDSGSGNTFVDSVNGITITQDSNTTIDFAVVTITFGGVAPTASFTTSTSGLTADFTDTSTDIGGTIVSWLWDFGDGNTSSAQDSSNTYNAEGTYTVTLTVTDNDGETDFANQSVIVSIPDTTPPSITAPANMTVEATGVNTAVSLGIPSASDDSNVPPSVSANNMGPFPIGTTTVTWTATDGSGNSANAYQNVTVEDTTSPSAPGNLAATKKKVKGSQSIKVTWNVSIDAGSGVDYYRVKRDGVDKGTTTGTSFIDPEVVDGTVYEVTAMDMEGNLSPASQVPYSDGGSGGGGNGNGGGGPGGGGDGGGSTFCEDHPNNKKCLPN
jgi:PKD repeat protein